MLKQLLSAALLLALLSAQNPIESTEPEDVSTTEQPEEETTTEEMYSTEDISSTYDSDSGSDDSFSVEGESGSSEDISSTDSSDSGSDDESDESSDNDSASSDSDNVNTESAEDDNDTDDNTDVFGAEGEGNGDDGRALDSESDDQDSSDSSSSSDDDMSSTAQGEDDEVEDVDTDFDDAGDDDADLCVGLDSSECGNTFGDDGMQMCGYNTNTDDCVAVVMTAGQRGRGNFDDGYTMAQQELDEQASELYTVIGILGGLVGLLMLTVIGGGYYIYSNKKQFEYGHSAVPMSVIDIDGGRSTTRGPHHRLESHSYHHSADITPMLDTM